jgi:hypothetical protein
MVFFRGLRVFVFFVRAAKPLVAAVQRDSEGC